MGKRTYALRLANAGAAVLGSGSLTINDDTGEAVLDLGGLVPVAGTAYEVAPQYSGARSYQPIAVDLVATPGAGKAVAVGTAFLAPFMGNMRGDDGLSKDGNYVAGMIGALSVLGTIAAKFGKAGLLGIIMDGVTDADAIIQAVLDGDSAQTNANAAFGVKQNNSVPGSGVNYGVDLQSAAHDGFTAFTILKALLRSPHDVVLMEGAGVPSNGTSGTGAAFAGPGSQYTDYTNANVYINGNTKASPTWKLVTRAA